MVSAFLPTEKESKYHGRNRHVKKSKSQIDGGMARTIELIGGPGEDRTPDPMVANHVLSQLSYRPTFALSI